jgi:hypothetical protein
MHAYSHPLAKYPVHLTPGTVVEHLQRPGVPLIVVSGPHEELYGLTRYIVRTPEGETVRVLRENLRT